MLDRAMRKIIDGPLNRAGIQLAKSGISANGVTFAGLIIGLAAAVLIAIGHFSAGLVLLLVSRVADGLDGAVARATQKTDFGGYFDIVSDFVFYGAIPFAFIIVAPVQNGLTGAFLLLSFYINGATFLGYAILAERQKIATQTHGEKNLYFTDGLLEGTETIAFFVAICVWPEYFPLLAGIFGVATFYTAIMRVWRAYKNFANASQG
jgi:phosphatidylglycerophosphate synthase